MEETITSSDNRSLVPSSTSALIGRASRPIREERTALVLAEVESLSFPAFVNGICYLAGHLSDQSDAQIGPGEHSWFLGRADEAFLALACYAGESFLTAEVLRHDHIATISNMPNYTPLSSREVYDLIVYQMEMYSSCYTVINSFTNDANIAEIGEKVNSRVQKLEELINRFSTVDLSQGEQAVLLKGYLSTDTDLGVFIEIEKLLQSEPDTLQFWGKMIAGYYRLERAEFSNKEALPSYSTEPGEYLPFPTNTGFVKGMHGKKEIAEVAEIIMNNFNLLRKTTTAQAFVQMVLAEIPHK